MQQIKATVIADSTSVYTGVRALSYELEYPRFIHSEFMTHRVFSRNAASSRAIPVNKMIEQVRNDPAMPVYWGKNQPGMQAAEELSEINRELAIKEWYAAANSAATHAEDLISEDIGAHKQITNRVLEPYQIMKVVMTTTEDVNFFWLRDHNDAQPEIHRLAEVMLDAKNKSKTTTLYSGEWHLPYLTPYRKNNSGKLLYVSEENDAAVIPTDDAKILSASLCAQVSYRKSDFTMEKAKQIFNRLIESEPCHASPIEHQLLAKDIRNVVRYQDIVKEGWTHMSFRDGMWWSGNIRGFVQWRQLLPNNAKHG